MDRKDTDTLAPPPPPRPTARAVPRFGLCVQTSPDSQRIGEVIELDGVLTLTVGRSHDATATVGDLWLSRQHFRVTVAPGGQLGSGPWTIEDLGTRNGTWVNGQRINCGPLAIGDVIRAGATVLVVGATLSETDDLGLIGRSVVLAEVRQQVRAVAEGLRPVHISGESGAGKEVVAAALHRASLRKGPFLAVNMATLVSNLAESQLFGHRRGAFTGAQGEGVGAFDAAQGGTLLLDEIGELDPLLQAKLLRAVDEGEVHRLGDARPHRTDVRLVTATHRDLDGLVQQGHFRQDLYWRIAHTRIEVPPLRERVMDVVPIADHVLAGVGAPSLAVLSASHGRVAWQVAEIVERYLLYDWPGNVRELRDEAGRLAEAMRHRQRMQASSPVPPLDEACSNRLRGLPVHSPASGQPSAPSAVASRVESAPPAEIDPHEAAWFAAVLDDRESLSDAIRARAGGRIRAFAEQASRALGRPGDGVRRHIYRTLGDSLEQLREPRQRTGVQSRS